MYFFINIILEFVFLDFIHLFGTDDKVLDWRVVGVLILVNSETGADMEVDLI